jgi:hypothetical protein
MKPNEPTRTALLIALAHFVGPDELRCGLCLGPEGRDVY